MNTLLLKNIKGLYGIDESGQLKKQGHEMALLERLEDAWLFIRNGLIASYGSMSSNAYPMPVATEVIDCSGRYVLPCFVDSHTHLVFARWREEEFVMRIKGRSYEQIAEAGGGILNSARRLQQMSEDELFTNALKRLHEVIGYGTGAIEIKSGYGLTVEDELKMLRVIKRLKEAVPIPVKATFLGAHAYPASYRQDHAGYINLIVQEMLPAIAKGNLAEYMDVFCDQGFFSEEETDTLLKAAAVYGLRAKIHGNELGYTGGVQVAVKNNALSVDHLEYTGDEEIACLLNSNTMPVALPGCSFFLGIPYAPLRKMIDAGLAVCLASDYNPGSTPNGRMGFVLALACTQMKLTPEEAINACTLNGAYAMGMSDKLGSITIGKLGNVIITKEMPSLAYLPYSFGVDMVEHTIINGQVYNE